jgi:hypothetical protein
MSANVHASRSSVIFCEEVAATVLNVVTIGADRIAFSLSLKSIFSHHKNPGAPASNILIT